MEGGYGSKKAVSNETSDGITSFIKLLIIFFMIINIMVLDAQSLI